MDAPSALARLQAFRPGDLEGDRFIDVLTQYEGRVRG
jgi:hypothetical protein